MREFLAKNKDSLKREYKRFDDTADISLEDTDEEMLSSTDEEIRKQLDKIYSIQFPLKAEDMTHKIALQLHKIHHFIFIFIFILVFVFIFIFIFIFVLSLFALSFSILISFKLVCISSVKSEEFNENLQQEFGALLDETRKSLKRSCTFVGGIVRGYLRRGQKSDKWVNMIRRTLLLLSSLSSFLSFFAKNQTNQFHSHVFSF
jgi:hypothetical protein